MGAPKNASLTKDYDLSAFRVNPVSRLVRTPIIPPIIPSGGGGLQGLF